MLLIDLAQGQLLPVCLLMSIIRTARDCSTRDDEVGGAGADTEGGMIANGHEHGQSEEGADVMGDTFKGHEGGGSGAAASDDAESSDSEESAQESEDDESDDGQGERRGEGRSFDFKVFSGGSDVRGFVALAEVWKRHMTTESASSTASSNRGQVSTVPATSTASVVGGNSECASRSGVVAGNGSGRNGITHPHVLGPHGADGMVTTEASAASAVGCRVSSAPVRGSFIPSCSFPGPGGRSNWPMIATDQPVPDGAEVLVDGGSSSVDAVDGCRQNLLHKAFSDTNILTVAPGAQEGVYSNGIGGGVSTVRDLQPPVVREGYGIETRRCPKPVANGDIGYARVSSRRWNSDGVAVGLVRFLREASGTSEALLRRWAGMLPAEEQAVLMALLRVS